MGDPCGPPRPPREFILQPQLMFKVLGDMQGQPGPEFGTGEAFITFREKMGPDPVRKVIINLVVNNKE